MEVSSKSRLVALILCTFLAIFGAHRFYVGKAGTAILMLLLCLIGTVLTVVTLGFGGFLLLVPGAWSLIDWFMILLGRFKDSDGLILEKW